MLDMSLDDTAEWYKKQLMKGFTKAELIVMLKELSYTDKQINEIISLSAKGGLAPTKEHKPGLTQQQAILKIVQRDVFGPPIARKARSESASDTFKKELGGIWKIVIFGLLLILLIVGAAIIALYGFSSGEPPQPEHTVDTIPPKILMGMEGAWQFYSGSVGVNCSDGGIDYASGCDPSTIKFAVTDSACPKEYSNYPLISTMGLGGGQLVCVAILDKEGNAAYSDPVQI